MFDYIKDANLKFAKPLSKRDKTDLIILHQIEGEMSVQEVNSMHINKNGYRAIAYNIYIDLDGTTYWGRGLEYEGGGVLNSGPTAGMNQRCVAIVCNGNFNKRSMPQAQFDSLIKVVRDVMAYYELSLSQVVGHRDVGYTDCPGIYFPMNQLKNELGRASIVLPEWDTLEVRPTKENSPIFDFVVRGVRSAAEITKVEVRIYPKDQQDQLKAVSLVKNKSDSTRYAKRINVDKQFPDIKGTFVVRVKVYDELKNVSAKNDFQYLQMGDK